MACHSYSLPPNTTHTSPPYSTFVHTLSSLSPSPPPHPPCLSSIHTLPHSFLCTHTLFLSPPHHSHTPSPLPITHTLPPLPSPSLTHSLPLSSPSLTHSLSPTHHSHTPSSPLPITHTLPSSLLPITHTLPPLPSPSLTHSLPLSSPSLTHSLLSLPPHPSPSHPSTAPLTVSTMTALSLHLSTTVVMVRQTTSRPRMTLRARRSFQSFQAWLGRREHRQHKLRQKSPNQHLQKTLTNEIDRCIVNQPLHNESNTLALTSILV